MITTLSNLLYGQKTTAGNTSTQKKEHPLIDLIQKKANLAITPEPLLIDLHQKLITAGVDKDHPILKAYIL